MPKKQFHFLSILTFMLLIFSTIFTGCSLEDSDSIGDYLSDTSIETDSSILSPQNSSASKMEVHFIDVGQADCTLLLSEGHALLIDAGNNDDSQLITDYLTKQGIATLDYVIGSHPHEDHIGSLDTVIDNFDVKNVIMPNKTTTTRTYHDVLTAIDSKGLSITLPKVGDTYTFGNASFTIIAPNKEDYGSNLNNYSIGVKVTNGSNSFIFTGDAELEPEAEILENGIDISADVLKAGHHGSSTSNSEAFITAINPTYAVIMTGEGNSYGHPHWETMKLFEDHEIEVFRTDTQGTIIATSDGSNIKFNTEPTTTYSKSKNNSSDKEIKQTETMVYITETGSKYHNKNCSYLKNSNLTISLIEAKERGLEACSKCKPEE